MVVPVCRGHLAHPTPLHAFAELMCVIYDDGIGTGTGTALQRSTTSRGHEATGQMGPNPSAQGKVLGARRYMLRKGHAELIAQSRKTLVGGYRVSRGRLIS